MLLAEASSYCDKQESDFQNQLENINIASSSTSLEQANKDLKRKLSTKQRIIRRLKAKILKLQEENAELKQITKQSQKIIKTYNSNAVEEGVKTNDMKALFLKDQLKAYGRKKINWSDCTM